MTLSGRSNPQLAWKVGSTFKFEGCSLQQDEVPVDLTGYQITSQIRQLNRDLVAEIVIQVDTSDTTLFNVLSPGNEAEWPSQTLYWDIRYQSPNGVVFYSQTIEINVSRHETWT